MIKKITITLCAIIIAFSTIFVSQSIVKADGKGNMDVIGYPPMQMNYAAEYKTENGFTKEGITGKYIESVNAVYYSGTINTEKTSNLYMNFTEWINVMKNSVYTVYIYSTSENNEVKLYTNEAHIYNQGYFTNRFYKFTAGVDKIKFLIEFPPNHTQNIYDGYYTFMMWQGDWEINADIVNSLNYQIGYNEGKIVGYKEGYNKGNTDGYDKGIEEGLKANVNKNHIFNYLKDWECTIGYDNLTNKGKFNLTSDNKSIYASGYYELIKDNTETENKTYFIWLKAKQNSEKFTFGYKELIYKGLPENTSFVMTVIKKGTEYTYNGTLDSNGKIMGDDWDRIKYDTETYLKDIIIESRTTKDGIIKIYSFKNYPSFEITSNEDIIAKSAYENGYNTAKDFYYNNWYIGRYQQGYNDGTNNTGNYTFLSLMGSVVDAPIKAISSMLNFDILGFNMMQFFYAIMTVCIIVTIVKLLL